MQLTHHSRRSASGRSRRSAAQKGYVLVMFAMLLVPMLLVAGLSVDVGSWYNRAAQIRKAADAAALAGVVWLPNEGVAEDYAEEAAARNGFVDGVDGIEMDVTTSDVSTRRIKVTITDSTVESYMWGNLGGRDIRLTRTSFAEYVLPVPLGSPRNFFGLGTLFNNDGVNTGFPAEYLYNSVNPWCTAKANGDRYQSGFTGISGAYGTCTGPNSEYDPNGYAFYIDAVENRPGTIEVILHDPRYNEDPVPNNQVVDTVCTYTYGDWQGPYTVGWGGYTLNGPAQYQTYGRRDWRQVETVDDGDSEYFGRDTYIRIRYPVGPPTCTDVYGTENGPDDERVNDGRDTYTFSLYSADSTPLNDNDNPKLCEAVFDYDTAFDPSMAGYLGSVRWNKMPCNITTGMPDGRYVLRVRNSGTAFNPMNDGSNQYGVIARYTGAAGYGLCDGRVDAMCPRVYGKEALSVKAAADTRTASFYLAEIEPEHAGKVLRITLFDPGEGGNFLEIHAPTGANTWARHPFVYRVNGGGWSSLTNQLDVTGSQYNADVVEIDVKLDGYNPPSNNRWWQIYYDFNSGIAVTDRTTWEAEVLGDPIHLVEEF